MGAYENLTGGTSTTGGTGGANASGQTQGYSPYGFQGFQGTNVARPSQDVAIGEVYTWEVGGKKYNDFVAKLRKWGYVGPKERISPPEVWTYWTGAVSAVYTMYESSGGKNNMTPEQYLQAYAAPSGGSGSGSGSGSNLPSKAINQIDPVIKAAIVRSVYQSKLGRNETPKELADELEKIDKGIATGRTATTKIVGGKQVTTYTPEYSQSVAEQQIGAGIESATTGPVAQDLKEKQSLDFMDFLNGLGG
jgi:hypothetical protein